MIVRLDAWSKVVTRAAAVVVLAAGASACSSVPSWVDPTTWIGGDDSAAQTPAEQTAENSATPDITNVPDKPAPASTADEQKQVADSLQADKSRTDYSGDQLRGGTEPSAPPPPDAPPPEVADTSASPPSTTPATPAPSDDKTASLAQAPSSSTDQSAAPPPAPTPAPAPPPPAQAPQATASNSPAVPAVPPSTSASAPSPAPASAPEAPPPTKMAEAEPPPAAAPSGDRLPAVPANSGAISVGGPAMASTDAALGFQRSSAPPLDASVGQFVPQQILSRYQETAEVSGTAGVQPGGTRFMAQTSAPSDAAVASAVPTGHSKRGVGGPEQMSGAVVANFESIDPAGAAPNTPSVSANPAGFPASSVVYFPHDTTILNTGAKGQIRTAVQAYLANGGQGYIRVVGHASSGGNVSMQRRMIWNFERSQARAKAVAQELIHDGIPADKVLVEAVGDSEPNYDPSQGEEGNRRAEIFFQT